MTENLHLKVCRACEGLEDKLKTEQIKNYLKQIPNWQVILDQKIQKEFLFKDFAEALEFVNNVGNIAQKENHHPDINLYSYKKVTITLSTHAISGLSENDFIVAAKIDQLI